MIDGLTGPFINSQINNDISVYFKAMLLLLLILNAIILDKEEVHSSKDTSAYFKQQPKIYLSHNIL